MFLHHYNHQFPQEIEIWFLLSCDLLSYSPCIYTHNIDGPPVKRRSEKGEKVEVGEISYGHMAPLTHISTDGFPREPDSDTAQLSWLAATQ